MKCKWKITCKPDMGEVRKELKPNSLDRLIANCSFYYPCRMS